jgi:SET domain-containing protein
MLRQTNPSVYSIVSSHHFAEVREDTASLAKSLHSIISFLKRDIICDFSAAAILKNPTYLTVQTGIEEHIHLKPEFLKFINHSCDPNAFFDTQAMQLIALKDIEPGDEFNFFYPSTEWDMAQPFECLCGTDKCLKKISGAAYMSEEILKEYRLTAFIQQQLAAKL